MCLNFWFNGGCDKNPVQPEGMGIIEGRPIFSPDGSKIAFHAVKEFNCQIYIMNADGSGIKELTNILSWNYGHVFSPGGSKIAFYSDRDGSFEIYIMNTDGSEQINLTNSYKNNYHVVLLTFA